MFWIVSLLAATSTAQTQDLQAHIDEAISAMQQLDVLAQACLDALNSDSSDSTAQRQCQDFLAGIDGELLAGYINHCATLNTWRENYVTQSISGRQSTTSPETDLQQLVGIDYACSDNALQVRTEFVVAAFDRLQAGSAANQTAITAHRRINELQFESTLSAERQSLLNALQQQQYQRQQQSDRQIQQLENELIRQQRSLPPN